MSTSQLGEALEQLVNSELIFRRGTPPDATYSFKHALVQDAAYQSLLTDPTHRLHGLDHRRHRPAGQELLDLVLQAREPGFRVLDGVDVVLQHDLLGGVVEADRGQPAPIARVQPRTPR